MRRRALGLVAALGAARIVLAQAPGESGHVPPDPPQSHLHDMPYDEMARMMGMDDRRMFGQVMLDRLEWQDAGAGTRLEWNAAAWYGGDIDKLRLESEGDHAADGTSDARTELLWDRIVTAWWNLRAGLRHDGGDGPSRDWAAVGLAGLAPGLFDVEASLYLGDGGRTALRLAAHRDYLLSQRWVLQPEAELSAYGRADPERLIGSGLADVRVGLRLRYEIRREFAPYIGVRWLAHLGDSADYHEQAGEDAHEWTWLAGIRAWL